MTWLHHLGMGFFGFTRGTRQRWVVREDLPPEEKERLAAVFEALRENVGVAFEEVQDVIDAFFRTVSFPEAPPFAGGILDAWPARMVDGLAGARAEWQAIQQHHAHLDREERRREKEARRG